MKNHQKKCIILLIAFLSVSPVAIQPALSSFEISDEISVEHTSREITDVIYRVGPHGRITVIPIKIQITHEETIDDALFNACVFFAEHDQELLSYLNESGAEQSAISFIKSRGRGVFFDFVTRVPVKRVFKKFPNLPPFYRLMKIHTINANYIRDCGAESSIRPLLGGNETIHKGMHTVDTIGFIGYTTWMGVIAKRSLIFRCGFAGYGLTTIS